MEMSEPSRFLEAVPPAVIEERATTPLWDRGGYRARFERHSQPSRRLLLAERDEAFFADEEDTSQDAPKYNRGERVRHRKFGGGVVQAVPSGGGRST